MRSVTAAIAAIAMNGSTNGVSPDQKREPSSEYGYFSVTFSGKNTESGTVIVSKPAASAARAIGRRWSAGNMGNAAVQRIVSSGSEIRQVEREVRLFQPTVDLEELAGDEA